MSFTTILLLGLAAVVAFILYRVGREGHNTFPLPRAVREALPVEPGALIPRGDVSGVEDRDCSGRGQVAEDDGRRWFGCG